MTHLLLPYVPNKGRGRGEGMSRHHHTSKFLLVGWNTASQYSYNDSLSLLTSDY